MNLLKKPKKSKSFILTLILIIVLIIISTTFIHFSKSKSKLVAHGPQQNLHIRDDFKVHKPTDILNQTNTPHIPPMNMIHHAVNSFDSLIVQDFLIKNKKVSDGKKIAFLTFDDGPSINITPKILKILNQFNINATFFIVGNQLDQYPDSRKILIEEYTEGNAIGNHTYSHDADRLYPHKNVDTNYFINDIEKNDKVLKKVLGDTFHTRLVRFPGGHRGWNKTSDTDHWLKKQGYVFLDWNDMTSDAEGKPKTRKELFERYKETFKGQDKLVILMHDSSDKENTAEVLPDIITDLTNKGYEFETLS